jgi:hypothetical protein
VPLRAVSLSLQEGPFCCDRITRRPIDTSKLESAVTVPHDSIVAKPHVTISVIVLHNPVKLNGPA